MFTGLVESVGVLGEVKPTATGYRLRIATPLARELAAGDSIAINGVCLTAIALERGEVHADVSPETARITTLGNLKRGASVNLERPLRADSRVGGHFVLGHVDGTGTVADITAQGESWWVTFNFPALLASYFVRKGSIAVDGVSLTVAGLSDRQFDVQIIPYTWEHTNFRTYRKGDHVNLECDILGKYVVRTAELSGWTPLAKNPGVKSEK
jgi:riboflavin synthase